MLEVKSPSSGSQHSIVLLLLRRGSPLKSQIFLGTLLAALILQGLMALATSGVHQIRIEHMAPFFSPNSVSVPSGTMIRWINDTDEAHTIIGDGCFRRSSCQLKSDFIQPHGSFDLSRLPPGRYSYHCGLHPFMRGTIIVLPPKTNSADI